ncbi:MAG: sulfite exporter TauE/SafE family protein [Saprospiraceae bacterium]|nr:sulfite exporter TauE/SafE family protein [Saprospiraceae bacterium]
MMLLIAFVAALASLLTLYSGFGLGTILTPVFGLFFPLHVAVALTGIVHLLNNLFKLALLGKNASRTMVLQFGIPSVLGGIVGATLLSSLSTKSSWFEWRCCDHVFAVTPLKLIIAILMIFFALMEILPSLKSLNFAKRYLTAGGLLSGFFGGLSGHQGALRSAFLINSGLSKEQYIATGVTIACMVDFIRLPVYFSRFSANNLLEQWPLLLIATLSAFAGAWVGNKYVKKITLNSVQKITAAMIIIIAILLGSGIV